MHFLLWAKGSHQIPNFDTSKCSGKNLPNFSCHSLNYKSVFPQILHHSSVSWKITPLYFFRSNIIYFTWKKPIKVQIFESSGQDSPNSCHFWNNNSVFRQILHQSSVPWDINPLYVFSWSFIYFRQEELRFITLNNDAEFE